MGNYRKLGKNVLLITIGNFASKILTFLLVPLYTALLTTAEYGTADLVTTTVTLLFPFFSLIISESMMRFALDKQNNPEDIYQIGMIVWLIGTILFAFLCPIISLSESLKPYILQLILYYVSYSLYSNISNFARGINKVALYSISGIVNTISTIGFNIIFLIVFHLGIVGYLYAYIIGNFLAFLFLYVGAKMYKFKIVRKKINKRLQRNMLKYSIPMVPNSISWWVNNSSDKYILTFFCGVAINGIYSIAYKIPSIIAVISGIFMSAWRISAVDNFGSKESIDFYSDVYDKYITLMVVVTSGLVFLNKPIAAILYSNEFYVAWMFVPVLLLASLVHSFCDFLGTIYTSSLNTNMLFYSTLIGAVFNICLNIILIPSFSAMGAAVATLLSYVAIWIIRSIHSRKFLKIKYDVTSLLVSSILLLIQVVIACFAFQTELYISFLLLLLIVIIRRKSIFAIMSMFVELLQKKIIRK